jgi:cation diffusion facilitator CzcD-associated flavoprotein CzcO
MTITELDAVIVGAGFGGCYQLWKLRKEGYNVKLFETASDFGGVWYWNCYPGVKVDVDIPHYEYSMPEVWEDWTWTERFPAGTELRKYFAHVDKKLDLRKDCFFSTTVRKAHFHNDDKLWHVATDRGQEFTAKFLLLNTGFASKRYTPDIKGLETFNGKCFHSSYWSQEGLDVTGKKVAVLGTGSTGLQIAQAIAKEVKELTVLQRTPNLACPMGQQSYTNGEQKSPKSEYPAFFEKRLTTFGGLTWDFNGKKTFDDTPEQRRQVYEELWEKGDFSFWLGGYIDGLFIKEANDEMYNFWREKTRARINDSRKRDILAPVVAPHAFGCKRVSLEHGYFEIFNQDNVDVVDLNATPIVEVTPTGLKTADKEIELDVLVLATGFDTHTGGLKQMDIRGPSGQQLSEKWADGTYTYLGMAVGGFPNMFFTYGPQAPTALCIGPVCSEMQGNWIADCMNYMRKEQLSTIQPTSEAENGWKQAIHDIAHASLLPTTKSVSNEQ